MTAKAEDRSGSGCKQRNTNMALESGGPCLFMYLRSCA